LNALDHWGRRRAIQTHASTNAANDAHGPDSGSAASVQLQPPSAAEAPVRPL